MPEVEFETLRSERKSFGRNNFIEIARRRAITKDGENEFISISRGYVLQDGTERFKRSVSVPDDPEIKSFIADMLMNL